MEDKEVHDMFHRFNQKYFWGKLSKVKLNWSKNMTLCAGKTYCRERQGRTSCGIYLSQPLLTQRPPEDTVNTLLHEMIHAYLFETEGASHKMGHGPAFREHMKRINKLHGSKITVFHNFREEVDKFRVHVYRCDGPCTKKRPYFGVLRRAITRPPGPTDRWWARHSQECGGTFHKVEGPDITPNPDNDTSKSVKPGSLTYPNTPPRRTAPSPNNHSSLARTPSQYLTPSPKSALPSTTTHSGANQLGEMASRDSKKTMSNARKRLKYDAEDNTDNTPISEDQLVHKIKQRHAHTSRSVLLSKEETKKIWRGPSPERGTLVDGRVNYNFKPKYRSTLNIQKYLERYRAVKEAGTSKPQKVSMFQGSQGSPASQKSGHQFSESDASWRTKAGPSSQPSLDRTHADVNSRTGGGRSQASVPSCVTCWNCGVNVMVPEPASRTEDASKPQKVSAPVKNKFENSVSSKLVACPSCGKKVPEEELNRHLDDCLMPFTDDF